MTSRAWRGRTAERAPTTLEAERFMSTTLRDRPVIGCCHRKSTGTLSETAGRVLKTCRPGRSTTALETPSRPTSPSSSPRSPSAAGSKHRQAGPSGNSSRRPAATAPSRSRPAGRGSRPPILSPATSAKPSKPSAAAAEVRTSLSQLGSQSARSAQAPRVHSTPIYGSTHVILRALARQGQRSR